MLVFIDESGDPGFKLNKGSTPIFVIALVAFHDHDQARLTQAAIDAAAQSGRGSDASTGLPT